MESTKYRFTADEIKTEVAENIAWLDKLLWTSVSFIALLFISRLFKIENVPLLGLQIKPAYGLVIIIFFSAVHYYVTIIVLRSIRKAWIHMTIEERIRMSREIRSKAGIFIRGITPRIKIIKSSKRFTIVRWLINYEEPPIWISTLSLMLLFISVIPWNSPISSQNIIIIVIALMLLGFNWHIGSQWAIAFSELLSEDGRPDYFDNDYSINIARVTSWKSFEINLGKGSIEIPEIPHHYLLTPLIIFIIISIFLLLLVFAIVFIVGVIIAGLTDKIKRAVTLKNRK